MHRSRRDDRNRVGDVAPRELSVAAR